MRRRVFIALWTAVSVALSACGDAPTPMEMQEPEGPEFSLWQDNGHSTGKPEMMGFYCTTSRKLESAPIEPIWGKGNYRYDLYRIPMKKSEFTGNAQSQLFQFIAYVRDESGSVSWAARCRIPHSMGGVQAAIRRMGLAEILPPPSPQWGSPLSSASLFPVLELTGWIQETDGPEECPWPDSYWSEQLGFCVVEIDGVKYEAGGSTPPPPPDDPPPPDIPPPDDPVDDGGGTPPAPPDPDDGGDEGGTTDNHAFRIVCALATRGQGGAGCSVEPEFEGPYLLERIEWTLSHGLPAPPSAETTTSWSWAGTVATSGSVAATVHEGGAESAATPATLLVGSRTNFGWSPQDRTWVPGGCPTIWSSAEPSVGGGVDAAWYCPTSGSGSNHVQPDPGHPNGHYTQQISLGPNSGLWFISEAYYHLTLGSSFNPGWTAAGTTKHDISNTPQASTCRTSMGLSPNDPVIVNFWEFNALCRGINMDGLHDALEAHERQHFDDMNAVAGLPGNDPRAAIEDIVYGDLSGVEIIALNRLNPIFATSSGQEVCKRLRRLPSADGLRRAFRL